MIAKRKPKGAPFDPACMRLAEHFLRDIPGSNGDDAIELAKVFQEAAEQFLTDLEEWRNE